MSDPTFWRNRPTLVTGATGFLGSHLTHRLCEAGAAVTIVVRDEVPATDIVRGWLDQVTVVRGDITDERSMERAIGDYEIRTVLHLAAQSQVPVANRNPLETFDSNIAGTWVLLEAARRAPTVEQVVTASSDKAYGRQTSLPYTESMPLLAQHPYDASKACADIISLTYARSFGLPVCITRCGNFFGPGDTNWERIVPGTFRSVLRGERPVIRSDGTMVRDYLYADDGALAYLALAEAMADDPALAGEAFNFSIEQPMSVLEMVEHIQRAAGTDLEPDIRGVATNEIDAQHLSAEKARTRLGWSPRCTVEEAMERTAAWYREHLT